MSATFAGSADFRSVSFAEPAYFEAVSFAGRAFFVSASFADGVPAELRGFVSAAAPDGTAAGSAVVEPT